MPSTFYLDSTSAVIMLAGVYYGAMYGGSTTSILVNMPGEAASVVTCLDGYQMARQGRGGPALGIAAFGSFIAGTMSIVGLMFAAPAMAQIALKFGPPEYFALIVLAFSFLIYTTSGSPLKASMMAILGVFIGTIGTDFITGAPRFVYGIYTLRDGIGIVPVVMGLFGVAEVLDNLEGLLQRTQIIKTKFTDLFPTLQDWKESIPAIFRGGFIGFFLGLLPGGGAIMASFVSYAAEKRISKHPERFGKGAVQGVAGPESANNSAVGANFIPLMTFGIPANVVMALILGALLVHGIRPGPMLIQEAPQLFWGVIASMYIGNVMLLILNLPLIGIWIQVLAIPYRILFPFILLFCVIGVYSLNNDVLEIIIMIVFGLLGYLMRKIKYEPTPLVFALVLSPLMENALRQSLLLSEGRFGIFFSRPISCTLMVCGIILFVLPFLMPWLRQKIVTGGS
jgi:putative tricarboxylic transport membrane protein